MASYDGHHASGFESSDDPDPLICDLCRAKLDNRDEFKKHLRLKHNIPIQ
jgi:hypothetical protein